VPQNTFLVPVEVGLKKNIVGVLITDQDRPYDETRTETLWIPEPGEINRLANLTIHAGPLDRLLDRNYISALFKLAKSIEACDPYTANHGARSQILAKRLSIRLGLHRRDVRNIAIAARLHDLGKVVVPKRILTKSGSLSDEEWVIMKKHPNFGAVLIRRSTRLQQVSVIVKSHHEHFDGSGYPERIAGNAIPLGSRIVSVVDAFTTMTDGRIYRRALTASEAAKELDCCSGSQFDPDIVKLMIELIDGL
jgi:HD-GYP domain-containing protein (c-di-GMP phosphodiesterase class II)